MKPTLVVFSILFGLYAILRSFGLDPLSAPSTAPVTINGVPLEMNELELLMNEAEQVEDFDLEDIQDMDLAQAVEEYRERKENTE